MIMTKTSDNVRILRCFFEKKKKTCFVSDFKIRFSAEITAASVEFAWLDSLGDTTESLVVIFDLRATPLH